MANNQVRVLAFNAISTLINLNPPISAELRSEVLSVVLPSFSLVFDEAKEKKDKGKGKDKQKEEKKEDSSRRPSSL